MPKRLKPSVEPAAPPPKVLDANQVVAYNFRVARELRGWTQEETARRLAPYVGHELPKASISGIERSFDGDRRRFFDAEELVAFSLAFDLPVVWFLLPPPDRGEFRLTTGQPLRTLVRLLLGRDDQLPEIQARMTDLRDAEPASSGELLAEVGGFPADLTWRHFQRAREEALFALVEEETSEIERLLGDLRRVLGRFDDLSQRAHYSSHPRAAYRAISHSLIGEDVFRRVLDSHNPADDDRYTLLRSRVASPHAIEDAIDLNDAEIVARLASVYDRAEELLQQRLRHRQPGDAAS
ncbi:MAG: helix-turn-helix domain-containing protein [Acidimicrobiales bacterium]